MKLAFTTAFAIVLALATPAAVQANDMLILKSASKAPDAVVAAIKSYSDDKKWLYLGDNKIKNGEITLVKVCIPAVATGAMTGGPQVSAMLPCGNIGVYQKGTGTEVSVLHPRYMQALYPHAATERASRARATPAHRNA